MSYVCNYNFYKNVLCENKDKPELQCNGKCHLVKEIKLANLQTDDSKLPIPRLDLSKLPISLIQEHTTIKAFCLLEQKHAISTNVNYFFPHVYINITTPPPDNV